MELFIAECPCEINQVKSIIHSGTKIIILHSYKQSYNERHKYVFDLGILLYSSCLATLRGCHSCVRRKVKKKITKPYTASYSIVHIVSDKGYLMDKFSFLAIYMGFYKINGAIIKLKLFFIIIIFHAKVL